LVFGKEHLKGFVLRTAATTMDMELPFWIDFLSSTLKTTMFGFQHLGIASTWIDVFFINTLSVLFFSIILRKIWNSKRRKLKKAHIQDINDEMLNAPTTHGPVDDGQSLMNSNLSNPRNFVALAEHLVSLRSEEGLCRIFEAIAF
jgi:hypothetical protein